MCKTQLSFTTAHLPVLERIAGRIISLILLSYMTIFVEANADNHDSQQSIGNNGKNVIQAPCPTSFNPTTDGTNGDDFISGQCTVEGVNIDGREGNDEIQGTLYPDIIYGKDGDDTLQGQADYDELYGGNGNDRLVGGFDSNLLDGGDGTDRLFGGDGDDQLAGGDGADLFYCGLGIDEVKDFNPKEGDRIIDNSTSGLHIGDEVGCEIGTGKDYDDFFEPPEEEIAEEVVEEAVEELANETGGSAPEIIAEVFEARIS
jgi:Ca2+-binding RTX toxin-like protein